jgi:hydrogenase nickel incorporation protein HypA/HybF
MHEWGLAEAVVKKVQKVKEEKCLKKIKKIIIKIGEFQQIEVENFKFLVKEIYKLKEKEETVIVVEEEEGWFKCELCNNKWKFKEMELEEEKKEAIHFLPEMIHAYIRCPNCEGVDFRIEEGRGVVISEIIAEK